MQLVRGVLVALLLSSTLLTGAAATTPPDERGCFASDGTEFAIGSAETGLSVTLHLSVFGNPTTPGAFGLQLGGYAAGTEVLQFDTGIVYDGATDPVAFATDPFSRFALAFDAGVDFPLSVFGDSETYEKGASDVDAPVDTASC